MSFGLLKTSSFMNHQLRTASATVITILMLSGLSIAVGQSPVIRPGRTDSGTQPLRSVQADNDQPPRAGSAKQQDSASQSDRSRSQGQADAPIQKSTVAEATEQQIQELAARLASTLDISDEVKQSIAAKIKLATDSMVRIQKLKLQTTVDQKAIAEVTSAAVKLRSELAEKPSELDAFTDLSTTLPDLVAKLAALQPELEKARETVREIKGEATRRSERRTTITAELTTNPTRLSELNDQLASSPPEELSALEFDAQQTMLKAQIQELNAQVPAYKAELSKYDAEKAGDLNNLQLQLAQRTEAWLQQQIEQLNQLIDEKRRADARYIANQLLAFASGKPAVSPYQAGSELLHVTELTTASERQQAAKTADIAASNVSVTADIAVTTKKVTSATEQLQFVRETVSEMDNKISLVGLTGAIGLELRKHLKTLPETSRLSADGRRRQKLMQEIGFERLELGDELKETAKRLAKIRSSLNNQPSDIGLRLLVDRHESLKLLTTSYSDQFDRLVDLDIKERELIREVEQYKSFIREQVLWIRSHRAPGIADLSELQGTFTEFTNKDKWAAVLQQLWNDVKSQLPAYAVFTLLLIILLGVQNHFRQSLEDIAAVARKPNCRQFRITLRALVLTTVLSAAWPCLPAFFSWRLLQESVSGSLARAVGEGLMAFSAGFFTLNFLRHVCRPSGLGPAHFSWPASSAQKVRRETYRLMCLLLPLLFCKAMLHAHATHLSSVQVLERIVFVAGLLVMAWYQARVLHPNHGIFANWAYQAGGWIYQLRWIAFAAVIGLPLILSVMAVAGYYYTAYELSWRLNVTTWIVIALLILQSFLMRLFVVQHRQLRIEQARAKRQALAESTVGHSEQISAVVVEEVVDLKQVSHQSKRLSNSILVITGLLLTAFVWADVHPALSVLNKWTVWETTVQESVAYVDESDGSNKVRTDQIRLPVTVADCLISIAILALTITATRNLPGFLEITVLQRLPIEPSVRYALRMVSQYFLVVIGTLMAFSNIGIGWDKVQWLAAALTVGLGFGLQEIFANFISGLIILFERPIRISDVVTIGDVSGSVSQIRMRATTITDWDLKEYIVPNKEFITGRLLNWTLSDKLNRVVIEVGVAYGTDTKQARKLLIDAANSIDEVMEEPGPMATFEQFGDSTLNLRLRCYLPNLENRLKTITDLHEKIDQKFKEANIEISFPQLDLHVVDVPPNNG